MISRRTLLGSTAAAGIAAPFGQFAAAAAKMPKMPLTAPVGLQLYSLRHLLAKDIPGTLAKVRAMGFSDVEVAGINGKTPAETAQLLKKAGLQPRGIHVGFDGLDKKMDETIKDAKTLGVKYVICPWLPHKEKLTSDDAKRASEAFGRFGKALGAADLRFAYHIHGYEFEPAPDGNGTLMDVIFRSTPAEFVDIEMDVFWVVRGSANPVKMLEQYGNRISLLHLKDIAKGLDVCRPQGGAPDDTSVPLGDGMIDWPGVFRAAAKSAVKYHFIEDEHPTSELQIPKSLKYLAGLKL